MSLQKLPIGEQSFAKIRKEEFLYVDKTAHIHRLITAQSYVFLSRPRRFGKSLTLSTIDALFSGHRHLFEGLWVEPRWDWSLTHPVLHIAFNTLDYRAKGLEKALADWLDGRAALEGIALEGASPKSKLKELVAKLAQAKGPVVLLIDEYDKPLIDYLAQEELYKAQENRAIIKDFYSGLKDKDSQEALRFFMITGVSKFSQVSIFSDLNYLSDLTLGERCATLTGYTQEELEGNFAAWTGHLQQRFPQLSPQALSDRIRHWYNGYSWDGESRVYNPFSILQLFDQRAFQDYWFKTGTPTFLINKIKEAGEFRFNHLEVSRGVFDSYDLENLDLHALLFQTGYLTLKHTDEERGVFTLDYPNREVEESMHNYLIGTLLGRTATTSNQPVVQLERAFLQNDPARAVQVINALLKDVPSLLLDDKGEHFYHALVHLLFRYLGLFIESEPHTSDGRLDAVVQTPTDVYLIEFKLDGSAEAALRQIRDKGYAARYRLGGKRITALGVNFGSARRHVESWAAEEL
jgi:hypothetical protein